jgi:hypothetical protein
VEIADGPRRRLRRTRRLGVTCAGVLEESAPHQAGLAISCQNFISSACVVDTELVRHTAKIGETSSNPSGRGRLPERRALLRPVLTGAQQPVGDEPGR